MDIATIKTLAENNDADAQNVLGVAYMTGDGIDQDEQQAVCWFCRASAQGNSEAMANLGMCFLLGKGKAKDVSTALYMLESAYLLGCFNSLAGILGAIQNKDVDIEEIVALSNLKNTQATWVLGVCYDHGIGVGIDHHKALELFVESGNDDNPVALWILTQYITKQDEPDLLLAKFYLDKVEEIAERQVGGLGNVQIKMDLQAIYERVRDECVRNNCGCILLKVVPECNKEGQPKNKYVQDLLAGRLFMKTLDQFGDLKKRSASSNNSFRGDVLEGFSESFGLGFNPHLYKTDASGTVVRDGQCGSIDILTLRRKVFCLAAIDYHKPSRTLVAPSPKMKSFGKYAVVIHDVEEFLRRVHRAFDKYQENNHSYCLAYDRVLYDVILDGKHQFDEFHKTGSYSWQTEFRISLDFSEGKFSRAMLEEVTDWAQLTFPGRIEVDENPLSLSDTFYFEIGDISDICQCMEIDELFSGHFSLRIAKEPVSIKPYRIPREPRPTFCKAVTAFVLPDGKINLAVSKETFYSAVL